MPDWLREDFAARGEPLPADVAEADAKIGASNSDAEPVADEQAVADVVTGHNWNPGEKCPCSTDPTAQCQSPEVVTDE
jgi:hypothetical protein